MRRVSSVLDSSSTWQRRRRRRRTTNSATRQPTSTSAEMAQPALTITAPPAEQLSPSPFLFYLSAVFLFSHFLVFGSV